MNDEKYRRCADCGSDSVRTNTGEYYCLEERRAVETKAMTGAERYFAERMEDKVYADSFHLHAEKLSSLESLSQEGSP